MSKDFAISTISERGNIYEPIVDDDGQREYVFPVQRKGDRVLFYVVEEWPDGILRLAVRVFDGEKISEPVRVEDAMRILHAGEEEAAAAGRSRR